MASQNVLVLPRVDAPKLDEAFLPMRFWMSLPALRMVRAEDGDVAALPTDVRVAWSERGIHVCFCCTDPLPLSRDFERDAPVEEEEAVGVFLDPMGERSQYVAILVSPYGRVLDARIENPHHRGIDSRMDDSWDCSGVRVRSWSQKTQWVVEMLIPFQGLTPAMGAPTPGDRWTGNFYRIERQPIGEVSAWQPTYTSPPDLHASDDFGILEFGETAAGARSDEMAA